MKSNADNKAVKFIKFDLTDEATKAESQKLANKHGLGAIYEQNSKKTGYALVVDNSTKKVTGKITKQLNAEQAQKLLDT